MVRKLDNADNMKHWQRGLVEYEIIQGSPGKEGAKMKLAYKKGKRNFVLVETITKNNFPEEFHAEYDMKGIHNIQQNYFYELDDDKTKWVSHTEFKFDSFMMKAMGFLMPGLFRKESKKMMTDFKNFAEKGISVLDIK
jgi:hypothetical protein